MADGMKTALLEALAEKRGGDDGEQDLFGAPGDALPAKSGPQGGRPKGARNRSTEQWRRFLISQYGNPLEELLRIGMSSPREIAEEMGLKRFARFDGTECEAGLDLAEAAKHKRAALEAALPYLAQKLPVAIEAVGKERGVLILGELTASAVADQGLALPLAPIEENQQVIDAEVITSDDATSDADANRMTGKDNPDAAA
jgi:hypothetical protein